MTCMYRTDSMQSITGRQVKNESFVELFESLTSLACDQSKNFLLAIDILFSLLSVTA